MTFRLLMVILFFSPVGALAAVEGPVRAQNLAPHQVVFLQPPAESPQTLARGSWGLGTDLAYATVFVSAKSADAEVLLDMETSRAGFRLAYGLGAGTELGVETCLLWMGAGVFDNALIDYHEAIHVPGGGREDAPRNRFAYLVVRDGDTYAPDPHGRVGLGDSVIRVKHRFFGAGPAWLTLAGRGLLKVPTGSPEDGFGSGGADGGVGLLLGARAGRFGFWANLDGLYLGRSPSPALELGTHWAVSALGAVTAPVWSLGDLSVQVRYLSTPYHTGLHVLDQDVWMLTAAFRRTFLSGRAAWSIGFTEDPAVGSSPDFSLLASVECLTAPR